MKMPQGTDEEKDIREKAMEEGLKKAIQVKSLTVSLNTIIFSHLLKVPDFFLIRVRGCKGLDLQTLNCAVNSKLFYF